MGSACCVAARDRTITDRSSNDIVTRNDRYSPSWSFRWDNRGRVAGEESSVNDRLDNKSHTTVETAYATEGSPLDSSRSLRWQKSPPSEEIGLPQLGKFILKKRVSCIWVFTRIVNILMLLPC
ncbi:hypothetical protein HanLR1_Chr16g0608561 [Helianthus annuus]|nr:hypothetical protein HanLR1_Chr16g0608561 [Helianthus annuus]